MLPEGSLRGFWGAGNGLLLGLNAGYTVMPCPKIQPAEHLEHSSLCMLYFYKTFLK